MNLKAEILLKHSQEQMRRIVEYVGADEGRFAELMRLFLSGEYRIVQRSSWAVSKAVERHPTLIVPYFKQILALLEDEDAHASVHRNILRLLQTAPIPKRLEARIFDICLDRIDDETQSTAVRAFAIEVAGRIAAGEPELLAEIRLVTERHLAGSRAAIKAKARNVLKMDTGARPDIFFRET
ncbi:MAG: hypothetical protein UZ17_ACD001002054 [Acidobacteria bacterium OLB17]|nr:MAG: hypothetical protein UZ17_ACD001002054 [Acidobacteria bacterium OLB17]MCZ2389916.1 hypothetical protein [Acidobacteriota bacterium]